MPELVYQNINEAAQIVRAIDREIAKIKAEQALAKLKVEMAFAVMKEGIT